MKVFASFFKKKRFLFFFKNREPGEKNQRASIPRLASPGLGLVILSCVVLVAVSIVFVDRPVALLMHRLFHRSLWFVPLIGVAQLILMLAAPLLLIATIAACLGWRPAARGWSAVACAIAVLVAVTCKDGLKEAFGRTWPETWIQNNPSFIRNGVYGFSPFHGGAGWASFPSGHTAAIGAVVGVLWWREPELRGLWALLMVLTGVGLIGGNFHFLSDVIAGGYLGFACGRATLLLPFPAAR
jgi:membrane-associated phospholipid phosphatase